MPEETHHENFAALVGAKYHSGKAAMRYGRHWAERVSWLEARHSPVFKKILKVGDAGDLLGQCPEPSGERATLGKHAREAVARASTNRPGGGHIANCSIRRRETPNNLNLLDIGPILEELYNGDATFKVVRASYDPVSGLSEFAAALTHPRRPGIDTFRAWEFSADPRNWTKVLPEMFERSEEIVDSLVQDRFSIPPFKEPPTSENPAKFPLFEVARLKPVGLPLTNFRNVLDIHFKTDVKGDAVTFTPTYCLHESLTNTILEFPEREGGIDVDSCEKDDSQVELTSSDVTIKAAKRIRFSAQADFAIEMNLLALPFLEAWITEFLIAGAAVGGAAAGSERRRGDSIPAAAQ